MNHWTCSKLVLCWWFICSLSLFDCSPHEWWLHSRERHSHVILLLQVARWEHRTRKLSRVFGSPYHACYCLGFVIILLNVYRSLRWRTLTFSVFGAAEEHVVQYRPALNRGTCTLFLFHIQCIIWWCIHLLRSSLKDTCTSSFLFSIFHIVHIAQDQ